MKNFNDKPIYYIVINHNHRDVVFDNKVFHSKEEAHNYALNGYFPDEYLFNLYSVKSEDELNFQE